MGQRHGENRRVVNGGHQQTTTNGRTAAYQPNLLNQYEEGETPPYRDVRGTAHPRATVSIDGEKADRIPNGEFHHAVEIDNASGPAHEEITILGVRNHAGPGGEDVTDSQTGSLYLPANPETFTHDPDGNLTSDGQWTYIWNAENQLTAMETRPDLPATLERQRLEFTYDHQGKRVRKQTFDWNATSENFTPKADLWFIYHGWKLLAEGVIENSEFIIQTSHLWGHDLTGTFEGAGTVGGLLATTQYPNPSISNTYFLAYDGNGNVAAAVNAKTGDTEARFHYGPFGETLTATGPAAAAITHRFSTKYTDPESGLLYYGYRYLNPDTGRWLNRDPIAEEGGLNLYGFVGNNSAGMVDYLGLTGGPGISTPPGPWGGAPPPPTPSIETKVNERINDMHNWHHSKQTIEVAACGCHPITASSIVRASLVRFSEFNTSNSIAAVEISGNYAGFAFNNPLLNFGSSIVNSDRWWVTLDGPAPGSYAQQARTNERHALIGMRRWGVRHLKSNNSNEQHLMEIWTEAYEVGNKLNVPVVEFGREQAFNMWSRYIEGVADMLIERCGGSRESEALIEIDRFTGRTYLPFLN